MAKVDRRIFNRNDLAFASQTVIVDIAVKNDEFGVGITMEGLVVLLYIGNVDVIL